MGILTQQLRTTKCLSTLSAGVLMEEGGGGELFADGFERVKFWRGLEEERCVVAKDSNHDHDNEDGQEDPVAKSWVQEERLSGPRHRDR